MRLKPVPLEKLPSKKTPQILFGSAPSSKPWQEVVFALGRFGSGQSCPQDIFNEHFLISLTYSAFVTPATPPGCCAGLEAHQGLKATTTCPTCGSWELNTAEPGLQNSNAAWAGACWPDSASLGMRLELWTQIWTWILGLDPRVWVGPHL